MPGEKRPVAEGAHCRHSCLNWCKTMGDVLRDLLVQTELQFVVESR
jgi:hypothetical protein